MSRADNDDVSLLKGIDLVAFMAVARRHFRTTANCILVCLGAALLFALLSDVKFTAQTALLIGNRQPRAVQDITAAPDAVADSALVDNQIEVIKSERVLLSAIQRLKLTDDPEFNGTEPPSLPKRLYSLALALNPMRLFSPSSGEKDPEFRMLRTVVTKLTSAITVTRNGKTNVILIAVTANSPRKASAITKGLAEAYLADQIEARVEAAKSAGEWFRVRLGELRAQSIKASRAVEDYRNRNNLLATNGQLVTEQQLVQLNADLAQANTALVHKQAQYDNLRALIDSGKIGEVVPEALNNSMVTQLRNSQAEAARQYNEIVASVGPNHEQAIRRKRQIEESEKLIFVELRRFLSGYQSELAVARERREELTRQLANSSAITSTANTSLVQLRQLEQEAATVKSLYQSFLQRYQETVQQESFPINDARVISEATPPLIPSEPRMVLIMAAGALLGLGLGIGIGAYRELQDRTYRTADQLAEDLGVSVFGLLPLIETAVPVNAGGAKRLGFSVDRPAELWKLVKQALEQAGPLCSGALRTVRKGGNVANLAPLIDAVAKTHNQLKANPVRRDKMPSDSRRVAKYAMEHPLSRYSETLRAIKIGVNAGLQHKGSKTIGILSSMPDEGKSTVSLNLGSLLALQGSRVALIDADLREAGLTHLAALNPPAGLGEFLLGRASLEDVLITKPNSGLAILPALKKGDLFLSGDLIASPLMANLIRSLKAHYDYIIVDLPPVGPIVDARAAAQLLDAAVLVVEWGMTPRRVVCSAIASSAAVQEKVIGCVLNKVAIDRLKTYEPYGLNKKQEEIFTHYYA
ncbi:polysaccharide biosynthesis tyrosine autokinase [Methylocystis sp. B8]|uniref:polysaccharide biosynthesis tyrosine autokinase n=1 Tax=Methylocystis sp. B8 TaxID=544938 RepID=UPI001485390A|nr:polysaccharide biosynthesis tyrosine autokinase [Methylocystis sp. B8]